MKVFIVIGLALACVACTGPKQVNTPRELGDVLQVQSGQSGRSECVRIADIKGYGYRDEVVTIDGGQHYYLATTVMRCSAMEAATVAAFDGPGGEICGGGSSRIRLRGSECVIGKVFEYADRASAFAALDAAKATLAEAEKGNN